MSSRTRRTAVMRRLLAVTLLAVAAPAAAQDKKKLDDIPGYKLHKLHGFTVAVSDDVANADTSKLKRKPLEALELELKNVAGLMTPKAVDALRKVAVWAEWDEKIALGNGRQGVAYATYYGGNQSSLLARGMHPLKARCVVVHLTKKLTEAYQDRDRPESLVLLHELAHAVHDQLFTADHPGIKAAYQQAMARKLYDKSLYCATNHHEFFAEMTCAFLDRLDYFPRTRSDLQKHDPETYKLMQQLWGKAAADGGKAKAAARPADGAEAFGIDFGLDKVRFGDKLSGPDFDPKKADGVTVLAYWRESQAADLRKLVRWHDDLGGYGLRVVLLSAHYRDEKEAAERRIAAGRLPLPAFGVTYMPHRDGSQRAEPGGHVAVFGPDGRCLFRGDRDAADVYVREAVGAKVFAGLGMTDPPKPLKPAVGALLAGEPVVAVLAKANPVAAGREAEVAEPAKKLVEVLTEPGRKQLDEADTLAKADPVAAFVIAERAAAAFKGTPVGRRADALVTRVKGTRAVETELKARKDLDGIKKMEAVLNAQGGSFDPTDPRFRQRYATQIAQMKQAYDAMRKKYPTARATDEAGAIVKEFGG